MINMTPRVACVCPTYCRPALLAKSIEMFAQQDYLGVTELIILDDSPIDAPHATIPLVPYRPIHYERVANRFETLPAKFNALASIAARHVADIICVWEDDDLYAPWHVSAHMRALTSTPEARFSKPSRVLSDYPGHIVEEDATGRFHASMAFTREILEEVGGWPNTKRADMDLILIANLFRAAGEKGAVDTCAFGPPSYTFKWHTGHYHSQHFMKGPDDEEYYDRDMETRRARRN